MVHEFVLIRFVQKKKFTQIRKSEKFVFTVRSSEIVPTVSSVAH